MIIKNQTDYEHVMAVITLLMPLDPELETPEGQCLDYLVHIVEEYEKDIIP